MDAIWSEAPQAIAQVAMGIGLAACTGLRAFLPLLIVGIAGRAGVVPLSDTFAWMESWPALIVFSVAVVCEILADKFPLVDHALDVVETFAKPVAGTILTAGVVTELSPLMTAVIALVFGGGIAGGVHLAKSKVRLLSTATTAGLGNPVLSTAEDAVSFVGSVGAIFLPLVVFAILIALAVAVALLLRRMRRPAAPRPA